MGKCILSCVVLKNEKAVELNLFLRDCKRFYLHVFLKFSLLVVCFIYISIVCSKKRKLQGVMMTRNTLHLFPNVIFQTALIEADKVQLSLLFLFVA